MEQDYETLMGLVEEVQHILEAGKGATRFPPKPKGKSRNRHNPFRGLKPGKHVIGKSGAQGFGHRKVKRTGGWRCKCANYTCGCTGIGADGQAIKKTVNIKKGYKKRYNKAYRAWRSGKGKAHFKGGKSPFKATQ